MQLLVKMSLLKDDGSLFSTVRLHIFRENLEAHWAKLFEKEMRYYS